MFYLIYIAGIIFFAVRPSVDQGSMGNAAPLGALYGFFTYTTYDLTNMATIDGQPIRIVVVDVLWGVVLCGVVSTASFFVASQLL